MVSTPRPPPKAPKEKAAELPYFASVKLRAQPFGIDLHPSRKLLAAGLISGQVKLFSFDASSLAESSSARPHSDACRAVRFSADGRALFTASSDCGLQQRDVAANKPRWRQLDAHEEPINALCLTGENGVATGDDGGAVKLWDVRTRKPALSFDEHNDFISSMLYTDAKNRNTLCAAGGDGCLSVFDLRKGQLWARSDPQEDELLCLALLKGGKKLLCGGQEGVVGIYSWGNFGDVSDRLLGHPTSVDCMAAYGEDHVLTGSGDGLIRLVGVHPNKVMGVVGEHDEHTVEDLALDAEAEVLASCGHDQVRSAHPTSPPPSPHLTSPHPISH